MNKPSKKVYRNLKLNNENDNIEKTLFSLNVEEQKKVLRQIREKECYSIVNRGDVWYKRLNDYQKAEVDEWYQKWLDVTETFDIPQKPSWLR